VRSSTPDQTDGVPVRNQGYAPADPSASDDEEEWAVAGRFVVVRDGDEEYRFRIEAEDGQLMATSEPYASKSSALKGVEAIKRNAAEAQVDDQSGDDQAPTATPRVATPDA
jgi:uncharacterized protein YegP (UPF0339 family)